MPPPPVLLALLLLRPLLFLPLLLLFLALRFPLLLGRMEMPAAIVIPVTTVRVVLGVAESPDPLDFLSAQPRREVPARHNHPRSAAAGRPEPAPIPEEVVVVLHV